MKLNYEIIASLSAIVVAVAALGVAIYEARVTREHQELSVWAISKLNYVTAPFIKSAGSFTKRINTKKLKTANKQF